MTKRSETVSELAPGPAGNGGRPGTSSETSSSVGLLLPCARPRSGNCLLLASVSGRRGGEPVGSCPGGEVKGEIGARASGSNRTQGARPKTC